LSRPTKADFIRTKHQLLGFVFRGGNKEDKDSGDLQDGDVSKQLHSSVRTANLETSLRLLSCGADPNYLHQVIFHPTHYSYFEIKIIILIGKRNMPLACSSWCWPSITGRITPNIWR
jgi:hypothetical protein